MKHSIFLTFAVLLSGCQQTQVPARPPQIVEPAKPIPAVPHQPVKTAPRAKGTLIYCTMVLPEVVSDPFADSSSPPTPEQNHDHWKEKSRKPFDAEKFRAVITERKRTSIADSWIASGLNGSVVCLDAKGTPVAMVVRMNEPGAYEIIDKLTRSKNGVFLVTSESEIVHVTDNGSLAKFWD